MTDVNDVVASLLTIDVGDNVALATRRLVVYRRDGRFWVFFRVATNNLSRGGEDRYQRWIL